MKDDFVLRDEQKEEFERLFKLYRDGMLRYAYSFIRDEELAEDIIQEAFIKVAGCMDKIREMEDKHQKNFLFVIVKNCSIDCIRRMKREWMQTSRLEDEEILADGEDVLQVICEGEQKRFLHEEIAKLKKAYQEVLVLKYIEELTDEEIARKLDISKENVRIRIYRAKKALAKAIRPEEDKNKNEDGHLKK